MLVRLLALACVSALLAGCNSTSKPASAGPDLRRALGTDLPGTRGATPKDQLAINETVAGGCAIGLYLPAECRRHNATAY